MKPISPITLLLLISLWGCSQPKEEKVDFLSNNWKTLGSAKVQKNGDEAITSMSEGIGIAYIDSIEFVNGIIECDMYSPSPKAYLGLVFRIGTLNNFECIYFQPHTSGKWDAIQYDPIFNSSATWQLYNGEGHQAVGDIPTKEWFHIKIKVLDDTAKVFVNNNPNYALAVKLKHEIKPGAVGVYSYHPAKFKNLKIYQTESSSNYQKQLQSTNHNKLNITNWHISEPYENYNHTKDIEELNNNIIKWHLISTEEGHLVNLNRYFTKKQKKNTVLAKVLINSKTTQTKQLQLGYSDKLRICLNSKNIYAGDNSYNASGKYEDRGYVLPDFESIELALNRGDNELVLEISEAKFGWGFMAKLSDLEGIEIKQ